MNTEKIEVKTPPIKSGSNYCKDGRHILEPCLGENKLSKMVKTNKRIEIQEKRCANGERRNFRRDFLRSNSKLYKLCDLG